MTAPQVDPATVPSSEWQHPADALGAVRTEVVHFDARGDAADEVDEAAGWVESRYDAAGSLVFSREGAGRWTPPGRPTYPGDAPAR